MEPDKENNGEDKSYSKTHVEGDIGENLIYGDSIEGDAYKAQVINFNYLNVSGSLKEVPYPSLRRRTNYFRGRKNAIGWVNSKIRPGKTLVIVGPGGIGKTTLVIECINRLVVNSSIYNHFPDGVIYHSFYNNPSIQNAFAVILKAFHKKAKGDVEQSVVSVLGNKKMLIVLDGCEEIHEKEGLSRLVDCLGYCGVIITTREPRQARHGESFDLQRMDPKEAVELLSSLVRNQKLSDPVAEQICYCVDYLPLGIDIAGNFLEQRGEPSLEYLAWLKEDPIKALDHGETQHVSMYRMIAKSAERLNDYGKDILLALGQFSYMRLSARSIEELFGVKERSLEHLVNQLARYGLVKWDQGMIICSHILVHEYARGEHDGHEFDNQLMFEKIWQWLGESLKKWNDPEHPNYEKIDRLRGHILEVIQRLAFKEQWESANQLIDGVGRGNNVFALRGRVVEALELFEISLKLHKETNDYLGMLKVTDEFGRYLLSIEDFDQAIKKFSLGLELAKKLNNLNFKIMFSGSLGIAFSSLSDQEQALDYGLQAISWAKSQDDKKAEGEQLMNLAEIYINLGLLEDAKNYLFSADDIAIKNKFLSLQGDVKEKLGKLHVILNQPLSGALELSLSLDIAREAENALIQESRLDALADVYYELNRPKRSLSYYSEAEVLSAITGNEIGKVNRYEKLAFVYKEQMQDSQKAKDSLLRAIEVAENIEFRNVSHLRGILASFESA